MADNEWSTLQPDLSKLLEPVNTVIAMIDGVLAAIIAILNIVQVILNVIKAFLLGLLDPIRAIIEAIIAEIRNIIHDLKNLGLYLTGDMGLMTYPFDDLKGGFSAFERRSIRRLLDRRDPNRPDFTTSSGVIAVFFYLSSQDVGKLIAFIMRLLRFFGQTAEISPYSAPTGITVKYGNTANIMGMASYTALDVDSFSNGVPDSVVVSWKMAPAKGRFGFAPAPKGFIVEVSTEPDGYAMVGRLPKDGLSADAANPGAIFRPVTDPVANVPLRSFSGTALMGSDSANFSDISNADLHAPTLQFLQDANTPPWSAQDLADGDKNGAAFYMGTGFMSAVLPASSYSMLIQKSDLPERWQWLDTTSNTKDDTNNTWYVRVRGVGPDIDDWISGDLGYTGTQANPAKITAPLFQVTRNTLISAKTGLLKPSAPLEVTMNLGLPSAVVPLNMPTEEDVAYIQSIQAAMLVLLLVRADLPKGGVIPKGVDFPTLPLGPGAPLYAPNTCSVNSQIPDSWRDFSKKLYPKFGIANPNLWFGGKNVNHFRRKVKNFLSRVARHIYELGPPPQQLKEIVIEFGAPLLNDPISVLDDSDGLGCDFTLLQQFGVVSPSGGASNPFKDETKGIGPSPMGRGASAANLRKYYAGDPVPGAPSGDARSYNLFGSMLSGYYGPERSPEFVDSLDCISSRFAWPILGTEEETVPSEAWVMGDGSGDKSPVLYKDDFSDGMPCTFFRNAIINTDNEWDVAVSGIVQIAGAMLTRGVGDSEWQVVRLLGNSLQPLEELLDKIEKFLLGILDALKGLIDKIIAYIESIQARIYQLQALINMIRALLNSLSMFALPSLSGLVLVEAGTAGIVGALATAGNKPVDSSDSYGAGVTMVAGGMPLLLLELLGAIFSSPED